MKRHIYTRIACILIAVSAFGQTQIHLKSQGKAVDFGSAASTRPAKTGAALPATCSVGELYIRTDVAAGNNLHICTSANVWTTQTGGTGDAAQLQGRAVSATAPTDAQALVWNQAENAWSPGTVNSMAVQFGDFRVVRNSATQLAVGANCSATTPCNVRFGSVIMAYTTQATVTLTAGSGMAYLYLDGSLGTPALRVRQSGLTMSCNGMSCAGEVGTAFPPQSIPLATWSATSGTWDSAGGTDVRAMLSQKEVSAGVGITGTETNGRTVLAVDTALIPTYLTAAVELDFPEIAAGACGAEMTLALAGTAVGDAVAPGWPALEAGLLGMMRVSGAGTVAVRLCNLSGAASDPVAAVFRAMVVKGN